jgi:hypothetical protein
MKERHYQCFKRNQRDSDEQPIVSIKLSLTEDRKDNPYFQRDMKRLTDKVSFSDTMDSEIVEFLATDFGNPNLREYELSSTFPEANVSVDAKRLLKGVYSNGDEIQFRVGRIGYTIRHNHNNPKK